MAIICIYSMLLLPTFNYVGFFYGGDNVENSTYRISIERKAAKYVDDVAPIELQDIIKDSIRALACNPNRQGHGLKGKLKEYRAVDNIKYKGVDYRIVYKVEKQQKMVKVMNIGSHEEYNKWLRMGFE